CRHPARRYPAALVRRQSAHRSRRVCRGRRAGGRPDRRLAAAAGRGAGYPAAEPAGPQGSQPGDLRPDIRDHQCAAAAGRRGGFRRGARRARGLAAGAGAGNRGAASHRFHAGAVGRADRHPERPAGANGRPVRAAAGDSAEQPAGTRHPAARLRLEHGLPDPFRQPGGGRAAGRGRGAGGGTLSGLAQRPGTAGPGATRGAMTRYLAFAALLLVLAGLVWTLWPRPAVQNPDGFSLQGLLGGDAEGFARAETVRPFRFPADHGAHPDYRSEWWYLTGNLYAADGRRFGFQFTLFRFALSPQPRPGESEWGSRQAWMAHLTVTDVASNRIYAFERFSRGAPGLAGAEAEPFRAWLDDWQLAAVGDPFPWQLLAAEGDIGLRLQLEARKPPVLQGEQGLSRKGPEPGNASYYYSYTRL